jgi:hypothetical protein
MANPFSTIGWTGLVAKLIQRDANEIRPGKAVAGSAGFQPASGPNGEP